jgi:hypothetical protein
MPIRRKVKRTDFEPCVARIDDSMATAIYSVAGRLSWLEKDKLRIPLEFTHWNGSNATGLLIHQRSPFDFLKSFFDGLLIFTLFLGRFFFEG